METIQFKLLKPRAGLYDNTPSTALGRQSPVLSSQVKEEEEKAIQEACIEAAGVDSARAWDVGGKRTKERKRKKSSSCVNLMEPLKNVL